MDILQLIALALFAFAGGTFFGHAFGYMRGEDTEKRRHRVGPRN